MVQLVDADWLIGSMNDSSVRIVDPRPPIKYLQGHIRNSVNVPVWKAFDPSTFQMLPESTISATFGSLGLNRESTVVIYDAYDGQNAAMLAWLLEYLGHSNVKILSLLMEGWIAGGREVFYRPVKAERQTFIPISNPRIRSTAEDILSSKDVKLLDLRTVDEYTGRTKTTKRAGHIPGAVNLPWTELLGRDKNFLAEKSKLEAVVSAVGLRSQDKVITYCSHGPRAAVSYVALGTLGFSEVRVYEGSFNEWAKRLDLPVET